MAQILDILHGDRPPEGDPRRRVYDEAVRVLGDGNRNTAINVLTNATRGSIIHLHEQVSGGGRVSDEHGPRLEEFLARVDQGIGRGEARYAEFEPAGSEITALLRQLRGGALREAPRAEDQATGRRQLPLIEMPLFDPGPVRLISASRDRSVVALGAQATPTTTSLFGGEQVATSAMTALGNAYATLANHPNDLGAQQDAARALHQALSQIPSNKEIWNSSVHPHFAAAMNHLAAGNLQAGLGELSQETAFNAVYNALNNLYVIEVNQQAISIMRAGVTVRYEFERNMEAFTEFIRGSREGNFQPRLLWLGMGMHYEYLLTSGILRRFQVTPGAGGAAGGITETERRRVTGTGHIVSFQPQLAFGFSAWGQPIEAVVHADLGYQRVEMGADVDVSGRRERLDILQEGVFVGAIGTDVFLRSREGRQAIITVPRIGAGVVAPQQGPNFYFNFTASGNWLEGNTMRLQTQITPHYEYFLEQHRLGMEIRPAETAIQLSDNVTLFFGPGFDYTAIGLQRPGEGGDVTHRLYGFGRIGLGVGQGGRAFQVDLRGGYVGELGGREEERIPSSPTFGLNITLTPQLWFGGGEERRVTGAVPRRQARRRREGGGE
jgi:hypothetical protein